MNIARLLSSEPWSWQLLPSLLGSQEPTTSSNHSIGLVQKLGQLSIVNECVQLHGGYDYMLEYPISRMWADSRVQRIYADTNEITRELIAWSL